MVEANSQPIAPPPMTTADAGSFSTERNSSDVTTNLPSTSKPGMVRGLEPEARMTESPVSTVPSDAPEEIETV